MGNNNSHILVSGEVYDVPKIQRLLGHLSQEIDQLKRSNDEYRKKYADTKDILSKKEAEILSLTEELDKARSVLQQRIINGKPDILATVQENVHLLDQSTIKKKQGVSGESSRSAENAVGVKYYEKDFSSKHLIKEALKNNDFLNHLDKSQIHEIVKCMYEEKTPQGSYVIRENEAGNHLYVAAEGNLEVLKNGKTLSHIQAGTVFGELAILYGCKRTASVRAIENTRIWVLERNIFQLVMMRSGMERHKQRMEFLQSVKTLRSLEPEKLAKIADLLDVEFFEPGEYIIREGEIGNSFYIISEGKVQVTQKVLGHECPKEVRKLDRGMYFGEKALLNEDRRTANVIALDPGVELLTLNREAFINIIGELTEFKDVDYGDDMRQAEWLLNKSHEQPPAERKTLPDFSNFFSYAQTQYKKEPIVEQQFHHIELQDLEFLTTLGIGGFGRVELVQSKTDSSKTYALKCLKKQHILETRQQEHIFNEKRIMMSCQSPYIVRVHKTFKDRKFVYMLMEACLGGELWTILRDRGFFDDNTARFAVACVLKAFQYLHGKSIVYRDLKPENLLVTYEGYVKLVDFGFAKTLHSGRKTWTFCGTPEYVAPEIILNKGHDHAVDIWAIGILVYELTTGAPPFVAGDPMKIYNIILKGIDAHEFPKRVSRNAQNIIKRLCRPNPTDRLGYQKNGLSDIMKHKWFQGFDWEGLEARNIITPFKRKNLGTHDASYFDKYPNEPSLPPDETSGWDAEF